MAEAIFVKYSKGSSGGIIPPELTISNSTKFALGLNSSATLDDCLRSMALTTPGYSTVQVTLKDVDGSVLPYHGIRMQDPTGFNMVYTTDSAGQCIFKTQNSQMTFSDWSNNQYFDVAPANTLAVDCPTGVFKSVSMQRYKSKTNGASINITSTQNINFSKYAGTVDVEVAGAGGRGGGPAYLLFPYIYVNYDPNRQERSFTTRDDNTSPHLFFDVNYYTGWVNNITLSFTNIQSDNRNFNSGGRGAIGNISVANNLNIQNKNAVVSVGRVNNTSLSFTGSTTSVHGIINSNDSYTRLNGGSYYDFVFYKSGATGGSSSFLSLVANGGAGGKNAYLKASQYPLQVMKGNDSGNGEYGYGAPNTITATVDFHFSTNNTNAIYSQTWITPNPISYNQSALSAKNGYVKLTNFRYK